MTYCDACWTALPAGPPCECGCKVAFSSDVGYASTVDRLMARGYDRDEAERLATALLEDDAA